MNSLTFFNPLFSDNLLEAFSKNLDSNLGAFAQTSMGKYRLPSVDVKETKTSYIIEADLPGRSEKDVVIDLKDRTLTISSSDNKDQTEKKNEDGVEYLIRERSQTAFIRRFTLPEDIDHDKVSACFENGILKIDIPRKPEAQARQIEIKRA